MGLLLAQTILGRAPCQKPNRDCPLTTGDVTSSDWLSFWRGRGNRTNFLDCVDLNKLVWTCEVLAEQQERPQGQKGVLSRQEHVRVAYATRLRYVLSVRTELYRT